MKKTNIALFVSALSLVSAANADSVITNWTYEAQLEFTQATFENDPANAANKTLLPSEISWGDADGHFKDDTKDPDPLDPDNPLGAIDDGERSALTVGESVHLNDGEEIPYDKKFTDGGGVSTVSGVVDASNFNDPHLGNSLTHWNNPISSAYDVLLSGQLVDNLTLTDVDNDFDIFLPELTFNFSFKETLNKPDSDLAVNHPDYNGDTANAGQCADGEDWTTDSTLGCQDLWGFNEADILLNGVSLLDYALDPTSVLNFGNDPSLVNMVFSGLDGILFHYEDMLYQVGIIAMVEVDGIWTDLTSQYLLSGECYALGLGGVEYSNDPGSCLGFRTDEGVTTTVQFGYTMHAVPLPAAVWFFGSALLGLVGFKKYRQKTV